MEFRRAPRTVFHLGCLLWWCYVWLWHTSPAAASLPGAIGFGWFFRYLTFFSYSLQIVQLLVCTADDLLSKKDSPISALTRAADDLSCAVLGFATATTILYHSVDAALGRQGVVEGEAVRPPWLSPSVHVLNCVAAWADLAVSRPRSFSRRSERLSSVLIITYTAVILGARYVNGKFPYPFLNKLPMPQGFLVMLVFGLAVFYSFFHCGKQLNRLLRALMDRAGGPGDPSYSVSKAQTVKARTNGRDMRE